jgi:hypothetical protein
MIGLDTFDACLIADSLLVKHQKKQIRKAFETPLNLPTKRPVLWRPNNSKIPIALAPNKWHDFILIFGKEWMGKTAYIKSRLHKTKGMRCVDVREIEKSLEDKSLVLPLSWPKR